MTGRKGTTLVEVLVAIFIMAIGLMTLLTLFPLGALSMSQAIKDTRTGHAAANAAALGEALNLRHSVTETMTLSPFSAPTPWRLPPLASQPNPDMPSYPVYVDPIGLAAEAPIRANNSTIGGMLPGIPRVNPNFITPTVPAARWFTGLDDMNFYKEDRSAILTAGTPVHTGDNFSQPIEREGRYSWAYLLRRPRQSDSSVCDVAVVVYSGRPALLAPTTYETTFPRAISDVQSGRGIRFDQTSNIVIVPYTGTKPDIRKGSWILDATVVKPTGDSRNPFAAEPHGFFYRVVGVTDAGSALALELQDRPKLSTITSPTTGYGVLIFMDNVVEVFEKGAGWQP